MLKKQNIIIYTIGVVFFLIAGCTKVTINKLDPSTPNYRNERTAVNSKEQPNSIGEILSKTADSESIFTRDKKRDWFVGVMVPLSGKNATIGKHILDAVTMAIFDFQANSIKIIPIDTGETAASEIEAAKTAVKMGLDVVLGPVLSETIERITPLVKNSKIKFIALSNDSLMSQSNIHITGILPESLMYAIFSYGKKIGLKAYGAILPSNRRGFTSDRRLAIIAELLDAHIMFREYFSNNEELLRSTAKRVMLNFRMSYKEAPDGKLYVLNQRESKDKEKNKPDNDKLVIKTLDALYIDARGADLYKILRQLDAAGLLKKNVQLMGSEVRLDELLFGANYTEGMIFAGTAYSTVVKFDNHFMQTMKYKPIKVASLAYDAVGALAFMIKNGGIDDNNFFNPQGFTGVYGDFRFAPTGLVERKFYVYRIGKNKTILLDKLDLFV